MEVRSRGKLKVYVYTRGSPKQDSPLEEVLSTIPPGVREFYRTEHLSVGAGSEGVWVSALFRKRIFAEVRKLRPDGSVNRQPLMGADERTPTGPFRVVDYQEEEHMAEAITVRLLDGKTTDNKGWKRMEREGKTYFAKTVEGKVYILHQWAAMGARIEGSLMNTPGYIPPGGKKAPSKESFVSTVKVPRRIMQAEPRRSYTPPEPQPKVKAQPQRKAFSAADVLTKRHRELTGRKAK